MRGWYQRKSKEERREWIARRDPEKVKTADQARYYRDPEKQTAEKQQWTEKNREKVHETKRQWREKSADKIAAHRKARYALRKGRLVKGACARVEEGACRGRIEMHHEDYEQPLDVTWLCSKHHGETRRRQSTPRKGTT